MPKESGQKDREITNNELALMMQAGFNELGVMIKQGFDDTPARDEMNQRFEQVDKRFDAVDKRFDSVERRLESLEQNNFIVEKVKEALAL